MSVQVRRRREAASFLSTYVGAQGELLVDTTNNRVQVHDGATPGGWPAAKIAEVLTNTRTAVADTAYTILPTDRTIAVTSITAARTMTLPAASTYPTGTQLLIFDESGACSATNAIAIASVGSDTINGAVSAVISTAYGYFALESDGVRKWTIVDQTPSASGAATTSRTPVSDANYTAAGTDRLIAYTALTAPRTVTLPAASGYPNGVQLFVVDEAGACSTTNTLTIARAGSDTINGATSAAITTAYGYLALESNGSGKWAIVDQAVAPAGTLSGTTLNPTVVNSSLTSLGTGAAYNNLAPNSVDATKMAQAPAGTLRGNPTGATANVSDNALTAYIDAAFGSTRGSVLVRGASGWIAPQPTTAGQVPTFNGTDTVFTSPGAATTLFPGLLYGLNLANNASNPTTALDVAADTAASDDAAVRMTLSATVTKTLSAWASGGTSASPAGALDTGTAAANTWYHVFVIYNPTSLTTDVLFSISPTAPTLPSGYTKQRRIGSIKSTATAANISKFSQRNDEFLWYSVTSDISMSSGSTTTATLYTIKVPTGVKVNALFSATTSNGGNLYVQSPDQSGSQGTSGAVAASAGNWGSLNIRTNTSAQIQSYTQTSNSSFYETTSGWIDTRGK